MQNIKANLKIKTKQVIKTKRYVNSEKYFFMNILSSFTKFATDTIEYIGYLNIYLQDLKTIKDSYELVSRNRDKYTKNDFDSSIKNIDEMLNYFKLNIDNYKLKVYHILNSSKRLSKDINNFKYEPIIKISIDIKEKIESKISNIKSNKTNIYQNSTIDIANSIINNNRLYNISNTKKIDLAKDLKKEIDSIQESLLKSKNSLESELHLQLKEFEELFVIVDTKPLFTHNIIDSKLIISRKEAIKSLLIA
jgi:hypothetical protein